MSAVTWERHKGLIVEAFVVVNFAFLSLDIWLAHSINRFRHPAEWIPLWFSIAAAALLGIGMVTELRRRRQGGDPALLGGGARRAGYLVGGVSILIGIAGMVYHLESQFFVRSTLASLVYTAPFIAPLAYTGLGFLLLANRMVPLASEEWGQWIVFLALGGFVGNFVLSVADHAQNGFFYPSEWIPVASSALAVGFLLLAVFRQPRGFLLACAMVLAVQSLVGVTGFALHLSGSVNGVSSSLYENFIYGAPLLAPMLFVNLALLAAVGLFDRWQRALLAPDQVGTTRGIPR